MAIPRPLHALSLFLMALLSAGIIVLVVVLLRAGPEDNLAGVFLVIAAMLAVPLLVASVLWGSGVALRHRAPQTAFGLVVSSVVVGGMGVLILSM